MEMSAPYTGKSLYGWLYYLVIILLSLPGLGMASLWEEFTCNPFDFGFGHVIDCWNTSEGERATALNRGFKRQDMFQLAFLSF